MIDVCNLISRRDTDFAAYKENSYIMELLKRSFKFHKRGEGPGIKGYAFRFNEVADYMGQLERFSPQLKVDFNPTGTFFFRDHNPGRVLARIPKTLSVKTDSEGLLFEANALDTELWRETRELVTNGVLNGASVGFQAIKERMDKKVIIYERIKLFEISLVTWPAYSSSEVSSRGNKTLKNRILPPELYL